MYNIITIERRYASGGHEIGKRLAESLGYKLYDRNILLEAAQKLDIPFYNIETLEESSSGNVLLNLSKTPLGGLSGNKNLPLADQLFLEEKRIIEKAAEEGNCVIVGRASGYILKDVENALHVFVYANHEKRIQRAIEREGIQKAEAENALKKNGAQIDYASQSAPLLIRISLRTSLYRSSSSSRSIISHRCPFPNHSGIPATPICNLPFVPARKMQRKYIFCLYAFPLRTSDLQQNAYNYALFS